MRMRSVAVLLGLFLLPLSFAADDIDQCDRMETACMINCCTEAGGTAGQLGDSIGCDGDKYEYDSCVMMVCRPNLAECVSPGSGCGTEYLDCFLDCRSSGGSNNGCDDECLEPLGQCVANAGSSPPAPACCGSAAGLLGVAGLAFFRGKR